MSNVCFSPEERALSRGHGIGAVLAVLFTSIGGEIEGKYSCVADWPVEHLGAPQRAADCLR